MPKFDVIVPLTDENGNAFSIIGRVSKALRKAGASKEDVSDFVREATSGNYDHLLQVVFTWVEVE
jgi:hypothetical protein